MTIEQYYRLVMAFGGDEGKVRRFFPRSVEAMLRASRPTTQAEGADDPSVAAK